MKSFYKLIIFFILIATAHSRDIILITYKEKNKTFHDIKNILNEKLKIPSILIKYKQKDNACEKMKDIIMHLCIDGEELKQLTSNEELIKKSFPVFLNDPELSNETVD